MNDREKLKEIKRVFADEEFYDTDDGQKLELIDEILKINRTTQDDKEDLEEIEKIMLGKNWRLWRREKWSDVVQMEKLEMILKVLHYGESWNPKPTTFWLNEKDD